MRLLLLTSNGPEHRYVARRFAEAFPAELQAVIIAKPRRHTPLGRMRRYARRYTVAQLASRVLARGFTVATGQRAKRRRILGTLLDASVGEEETPLQLVQYVPSHNGSAAVELVQSLAPDIIAVYGTVVIRAPIIRLARQAILNMHTGISPRYRGANTVFWPLYNAEPEWVGLTIHQLTEEIDAGPILEVGRPTIAPDDDENSLFCKCVMVGTKLYVRAVRAVARGTAEPRPQELNEGREYRFVDRTIWAELRVRHLLAHGLLRRYAETHS